MTSTIDAVSTDERLVRDRIEKLLADFPPKSSDATTFLGAQYDAGLAWVHFPEGYGGLGLSPKLQSVINEELAAVGAPTPYYRNPIGHGMGAPTVVTHGSEKQKQRYLRPLFTGEEVWCQLFSEPAAGSDVPGLSSRALRDWDASIVNHYTDW